MHSIFYKLGFCEKFIIEFDGTREEFVKNLSKCVRGHKTNSSKQNYIGNIDEWGFQLKRNNASIFDKKHSKATINGTIEKQEDRLIIHCEVLGFDYIMPYLYFIGFFNFLSLISVFRKSFDFPLFIIGLIFITFGFLFWFYQIRYYKMLNGMYFLKFELKRDVSAIENDLIRSRKK